MPKYQYSCINCDLDIEKERSIQDLEPAYFCDKCGYKLSRVYETPVIKFNGKGFYSTDN